MNGLLWFFGTLGLAVVLIMLWQIGGPAEIKRYFQAPGRDRVRQGIEVFLLAGVLAALLSVSVVFLSGDADAAEPPGTGPGVEWFTFGEVYLGVDYTMQTQAPSCFDDGANPRLTSNGGVRANILQVDRFRLNGKYTHHSCVLNSDRYLYDGVGLEATYRLW